jgi:hypothetical protein
MAKIKVLNNPDFQPVAFDGFARPKAWDSPAQGEALGIETV